MSAPSIRKSPSSTGFKLAVFCLSCLFLLPALSAAQGSTVRIRTGSGAFTDSAGNVWSADNYFNTGSPYITTAAIDGTTNDALYQGERWDAAGGSELTYNIPVTPGAYKVRLHFAEIYFSAAGQRIFDVSVEGAVAFANLDVFAQAGAKNKALVKETTVTVTDNTLSILFIHKTENPKISSIEILPAAPVTPTPKLVATPASLAFGSVLVAQTSSLNVTLSNTGTASLSISGITLSGAQASQFKVTATPITLAAAATATLPVQFAPTVTGAAAATLTLVSNDPVTPSQAITLSGQGYVVTPPALSVSPTSVNFAATTVGSASANTNIILTNTGGSALTVSAFTLSGAQAADFAFTAPALPLTLAPAATASLPVRFSPTAAGARSASLAIASNQAAGNVNVALAGTANAAPPPATQPTHRIIAGGPSYTDGAGNVWNADQYFNTGEPYVSTAIIEGTTDDALYQTERWDAAGGEELTYAIPVTAGIYKIRLHFAEIYFAAPGLRVFDVAIDDQVVFPNLDIFAQASGKNKALVKEIEVTVNTDTLYISFLHKIENPKINALEILPMPNSHSHPFLHVVIDSDSLVVDHDGNGVETVRFNGSSSHTHELGKTLVSRKWKLNQVALLDAVRVDIDLPLGTHTVTLDIADNNTPPQTLSGSKSVRVVSPDWVPGALMHFYSSVGDPSPWLDALPAKADFAQIQPRLFLSPATAPVAPPFLATYSARLDLAAAGVYNFSVEGGSSRRLFINGNPVTGPMNLAIGVYELEARIAVNPSDISPLAVTYSLGESPLSPIPPQIVFHSEAGLKPVVNLVSGEGSKEGGFPVQISGLGFFPKNQVQVHLGNQVFQGSSLLLTSSTIQFTAPPGTGNVEATVMTPHGTSKPFFVKYNDGPSTLVSFVSYALTSLASPTQAAWGPDGRLYVSSISGIIKAYTLSDDYQIVDEQTIDAMANLPNNDILGIAFNPKDTGPVKLYVAHSHLHGNGGVCFTGTSDYNGQVSVLTGPNFTSVQPVITNLPVSNHDHGPSGLEFDNQGDLLLTVGGNTNAGIAACNLGNVPESPLSSSIVKAQLSKPGFNGAITYLTPSGNVTADQVQGGTANLAPGLDLSVFASGLRNTYDLTVTTSNQVYATDNGPNFGFGPASTSATTQGAEVEADDELNLIVQGAYYGHPNRNRGRTDNRQNVYYAPGAAEIPGVFTQAMVFVPASTNGIVEYRAQTFGGALRGKLILQKWDGATYQAALSPDGKSVTSVLPLPVDLLGLDVTAAPGGVLISADYSKNRVVIAKPITSVIGFQAYDIFPWRASSEGGSSFEIGGEGFGNMSNTTVTLGGVSATLTSVSPTRIKGIVPHKSDVSDSLEDVAVTVSGITKTIPKAFLFLDHSHD